MSLYKHVVPDSNISRGEPEYVPATLEEIKASHPECGKCKHIGDWADISNEQRSFPLCDCVDSPCWGNEVNPASDYCNYYDPKEPG